MWLAYTCVQDLFAYSHASDYPYEQNERVASTSYNTQYISSFYACATRNSSIGKHDISNAN